MNRPITLLGLFALMFLVASCSASGPQFNVIESTFPKLQGDHGRIYFYRIADAYYGAALRPDILLNGQKVGRSVPGGFFYVDTASGPCEVSTGTEVKLKVSFMLKPTQTVYVETRIGHGILVSRIIPELIDPDQGILDIQDLAYIGKQ